MVEPHQGLEKGVFGSATRIVDGILEVRLVDGQELVGLGQGRALGPADGVLGGADYLRQVVDGLDAALGLERLLVMAVFGKKGPVGAYPA